MNEETKIPLPADYRASFDEAMANMFSNPTYSHDYLFYAHVIGQMRVYFDTSLQAPAGMNFMHDHYCLYINPLKEIPLQPDKDGNYPQDDNGNEIKSIPGFSAFNIPTRLGVLKHEALHMLHFHIGRRQDRNHQGFNIAADCAINQQITRKHLPDKCIFPEQFPSHDGNPVPENLTAEQYYELLKFDENGDKNGGGGQGPSTIDDHSKWDESQGDQELAEDIAKSNVEKAISQTQKSRGNIPADISEILDALTKKREVDWKRVLRRIVSHKKAGIRKTLMRPDRRFPSLHWIKGKTKDRTFEAAIISDVSGSVSTESLMQLWGEVIHICKLSNTPIKLVQVDTRPTTPEDLKPTTKTITRKACGGTTLYPAIDKLREHGVQYSVLIVTTDGYLDEADVMKFHELKVPVIWLIEHDGRVMPEMSLNKHRVFRLKEGNR